MKIIFIRHAEPDYGTDTLTEKGRKEAVPERQLPQHCRTYAAWYKSNI